MRRSVVAATLVASSAFVVALAVLWVGWRIGLRADMLLAGLAVVTLLSLFGGRGVKPREALDPMSGPQRLLVALALYSAIALHGYAIVFSCDILFG